MAFSSPHEKPKLVGRLLVLGQARTGTTLLISLLRCSRDLALVAAEPAALPSRGIVESIDHLLESTENTASLLLANDVKYVGCRVTPEQLYDNGVRLDDLVKRARINQIVVVTRDGLLDVFVSKKLADETGVYYATQRSEDRKEVVVTNEEFSEFRRKNAAGWEYVADSWPEGVEPLFAPYESLSKDPQGTASRLWERLGCDTSMPASTPMVRHLPLTDLRAMANYDELLESSRDDLSTQALLSTAFSTRIHKSIPQSARLTAIGQPTTTQHHHDHHESLTNNSPAGAHPDPTATLHNGSEGHHVALTFSKWDEDADGTASKENHPTKVPPEKEAATLAKKQSRGLYQLVYLTCIVMVFHCLDGALKEKVFHLPGFFFVEVLSLLQAFFIACFATVDWIKASNGKLPQRSSTPLWVFLLLSCFMASSYLLANRAILYTDFVTQVVFKSSKLLFIMAARLIFLSDAPKPNAVEWAGSVCVVLGLICMSATTVGGGAGKKDGSENTVGLLYLCLSLVCDAGVYVVQEKYAFGKYNAGKQEVILGMQTLALLPSAGFVWWSGTLTTAVAYSWAHPSFMLLVAACAGCSFMGTRAILQVIQEYNGTSAALITSFRKLSTILLSYYLFPDKSFTLSHLAGISLILAGANVSVLQGKCISRRKASAN
ncbi:Adenosine 3prime-phospho 5prime-phosphosulfate transporter 2 [Diplonema papillatum]|nr:Adenosine 3prime-phospho 5prime-phosphosulfate transporter 2 [Diplonema papillatum]